MRNKKNIIIAIMIAVALIMATGYAYFLTKLNINATGNISSTWNVYFLSIDEGTAVGNAENIGTPSVTGTSATMSAKLDVPGDSMTYTLILKNGGTVPAIIEEISAVAEGSSAIIFSIDGIKKGDKLAGGAEKTITIKIEYDPNVTSQPIETTKTLTININAVQDTGQKVDEENLIIEGQDNLLVTKILGKNKSNVVSSGDGLYVSTATNDGSPTYYYRGAVENNYVQFGSTSGSCIINVNVELQGDQGFQYNSQKDKELCLNPSDYGYKICDYGDYYEINTSCESCYFDNNDNYICDDLPTISLDGKTEWQPHEEALWRVVRINEDGTIRLITESFGIWPGEGNYFCDEYYSEGLFEKELNKWYANNLSSYDSQIATSTYCEAAKVQYDENFSLGNATWAPKETYIPDFKCPVDDGNGHGLITNQKVGLITYDEVEHATAAGYLSNKQTPTMTPIGYASDTISLLVIGNGGVWDSLCYSFEGVHPVINLNANVTVTGTGTAIDPYVVKTN